MNADTPPDQYAARVTGSRETLEKLMKEFDVDAGCRPHPEVHHDHGGSLLVYASEEQIRLFQTAGYRVERGENVSEIGRQRQAEIGKGDRFEGGRIAPRGLGKKPVTSERKG